MATGEAHPLITAISIRDLFGRKSYDVPIPHGPDGPARLVLLHGDNGSGKTTLLRLIWHTLSYADDQGHRSFLSRTPFSSLRILMTDSRSILVEKADGLLGDFKITVVGSNGDTQTAEFEADVDLRIRNTRSSEISFDYYEVESPAATIRSDSQPVSSKRLLRSVQRNNRRRQGVRAYLEFLQSDVGIPLYLADDRSIYSDDPDIARVRDLLWRRDEPAKSDRLGRLALNELQITLRRVNEYLRRLAIGGQNDGSANSDAIYLNVLRQLVQGGSFVDRPDGLSSEELLAQVADTSPEFEKYGLVPSLDTDELSRLLKLAHGELAEPAERVISPFLSSLRARYEALSEAQRILDSLVPTVNSFLKEKRLHFSPQAGLNITVLDGDPLDVKNLSSGERQLLMLLYTTLLARVESKVFIIDEPELSLGVDWQRKIMQALLDVTAGSNLQFLIATHSIEIISGSPESLVQLQPL